MTIRGAANSLLDADLLRPAADDSAQPGWGS
jgi:hypothetical protein